LTIPSNNARLRRNNFDLLRLLFAGTVGLVHASVLSGQDELEWIVAVVSSDVAVQGFFVISGFLIFMSYERSQSLTTYLGKRARRIYPAYFVVVTLCALLLWTVSSLDFLDYFSFSWLKYLVSNLAFLNFLHPTLPGVFETNKLQAVDGALWTLKIEVMFYAVVPIIVYLFSRFGRFAIMITIYFMSVGYAWFMTAQALRTGSDFYAFLARQLPGQMTYFIAGAFVYYFLPLFERNLPYFLAFAIIVLLMNFFYPLPTIQPMALAFIVLFFGLYLYVGNFGKFGDFSYGVYIIHFPIIQLLVHLGWFRFYPLLSLIAATTLTLIGAFAMWHLVEKRFLSRRSHYITANDDSAVAESLAQPGHA
jgi:peptidoglycan/LPS O-acetylase OafA/YrhL